MSSIVNANSVNSAADPSSSRFPVLSQLEYPAQENMGVFYPAELQGGNPGSAYPDAPRQPFPVPSNQPSGDEGYASASLSPTSDQQFCAAYDEVMAQWPVSHAYCSRGHPSQLLPGLPNEENVDVEADIARLEADILDYSAYDKENQSGQSSTTDDTKDEHCFAPLLVDCEELAMGIPPLSDIHNHALFPTQALAQADLWAPPPLLLSSFAPLSSTGCPVADSWAPPPMLLSSFPPPPFAGDATAVPTASTSALFLEPGPSRPMENGPGVSGPTPTADGTARAPRRNIRKRARAAEPDPSTPFPPLRNIRPRLDTVPTLWSTIGNTGAPVSVAPPCAGAPVAGSSRRAAATEDSEGDSEDDGSDDETEATGAPDKRDRRRHGAVVATTLDLDRVPCPVDGCETFFDPTKHPVNRKHLIEHYGSEAIKGSAPLACLWGKACGESVAGKSMITHVHAEHVGLAFFCPVEGCEWRASRSGDLRLHYRRKHPGLRVPE